MTGIDKLIKANQEAAEQLRIASLKNMKERILEGISNDNIFDEANYRYVIEDEIEAFIQGAIWYREKLRQGSSNSQNNIK